MKNEGFLVVFLSFILLISNKFVFAGQVEHLLIIGNSMTFHLPNKELLWSGNWGMAASREAKDFSHVLASLIGQKQVGNVPILKVQNLSDFELNPADFKLSKLNTFSAFQADSVVIFLGDNIKEETLIPNKFSFYFGQFLDAIKNINSGKVYCVSTWWSNSKKDGVLKSVCEERGGVFVDISDLYSDPKNRASAENPNLNAGVAIHPGDKGMREIANRIAEKMFLPVLPR